nr:phage tail protein [Escherichia coli]
MMPVSCYLCIFLNVGLGTAAKKDVGTGTGQIPDMSNFTYAGASNVFTSIVIAGNRRIMEGSGSGNFVNGVLSFTLPLAYPSTGFTFIPTDVGSGVVSYAAIPESGSVVTIYGKDAAGANLNGSFSFKYMAMGSA